MLDKPVISKEFLDEVRKVNIPLVWLDHHDVNPEDTDCIFYFNSMKGEKPSSEPVTYWAWQATKKKDDMWIAMCGCIGDSFLPEFTKEFEEKYPDLWKSGIKKPMNWKAGMKIKWSSF